tara:strand:- start:1363 stop:1779 length:417 start_codon:yes stop_codon:yes gene_type:complete
MNLSKEQIDAKAIRYNELLHIIKESTEEKRRLELELQDEFKARSEDEWASRLVGNEMEIKRGKINKTTSADDLRAAVGELVDKKTLDSIIRQKVVEIKEVPDEREINKLITEGGEVAKAIKSVRLTLHGKITASRREL